MAAPTGLDLFTGPRGEAYTYMFRYGGLLLALVCSRTGATLDRAGVGSRGALSERVQGWSAAPRSIQSRHHESRRWQSRTWARDDPELHRALTGSATRRRGSVIAVNNQWIDEANGVPLEFIYSAFSERRVYLEGWASRRRRELGTLG